MFHKLYVALQVLILALAVNLAVGSEPPGSRWKVTWYDTVQKAPDEYGADSHSDAEAFIRTHLQATNLETGEPAYTNIKIVHIIEGGGEQPVNRPTDLMQAAREAGARASQPVDKSQQAKELADKNKDSFEDDLFQQQARKKAEYEKLKSSSASGLDAAAQASDEERRKVQAKFQALRMDYEKRDLEEGKDKLETLMQGIIRDRAAGIDVSQREKQWDQLMQAYRTKRDDLQKEADSYSKTVEQIDLTNQKPQLDQDAEKIRQLKAQLEQLIDWIGPEATAVDQERGAIKSETAALMQRSNQIDARQFHCPNGQSYEQCTHYDLKIAFLDRNIDDRKDIVQQRGLLDQRSTNLKERDANYQAKLAERNSIERQLAQLEPQYNAAVRQYEKRTSDLQRNVSQSR